jgi:glutathione S-transferase
MTSDTTIEPVRVRGVPGSPCTRKMIALLRFRHVPYRWLVGEGAAPAQSAQAAAGALPVLQFNGDDGCVDAGVDCTPFIRRLERAFQGRSVVPLDPVVALLDRLIEDFADEWVAKAMPHFRWQYALDSDHASDIMPRWTGITASEARLRVRKHRIEDHQGERLRGLGSNDTTGPLIEEGYHRLLALLRAHLQHQPFLFGGRPASADFALYGHLSQLTRFDPTPMAIALQEAPRVVAWVDVMDDLSGLDVDDSQWLGRADAIELATPFLHEIGRTWVPVLRASAEAVDSGTAEVDAEVEGLPWVQFASRHHARCLEALRAAHARVALADRAALDDVFARTGCAPLFAARALPTV